MAMANNITTLFVKMSHSYCSLFNPFTTDPVKALNFAVLV